MCGAVFARLEVQWPTRLRYGAIFHVYGLDSQVIVVDEGPGSSNAVQQLEALSYKATKCTSVAEAISQTILSPEPDVCLLEAKYIRNAAPG